MKILEEGDRKSNINCIHIVHNTTDLKNITLSTLCKQKVT